MAVRPCFEGGGRRGRAGGVSAQLDIGLCGLYVIDHGAELVDEAHQGHVNSLADGLAGSGEVTVECVVVAAVEVMEGERGRGGSLWGAGRLLHHNCIQAERLDQKSWLKLKGRKVHHALSVQKADRMRVMYIFPNIDCNTYYTY